MPIILDGEVNNPLRPLTDYSLPFGEYLSTKFADQFANNPMNLLGRAASVQEAQSGTPMIDAGFDLMTGLRISPESDPATVNQLDAATAREKIKQAGVTLSVPDSGISDEALRLLIEHKQEDTARQVALQRSPTGMRSIAGFGASFAAGLLDPLNIAAGFVPVIGEQRYAAMLANASGAFGRTGVRAGVGAVEGAVGTAAIEPAIYRFHQQLQDDYTMADSLLNIAFGSALGGGLHAGGGLVKDVIRGAPVKSMEYRPDLGVEEGTAAVHERRQDLARRKAVAEMTPEEMRKALLVDEMTGLGNRRAYNEVDKKPFQASIDIDSLKWVNDNLGHDAGDQLIAALGRALREESADAYHLSGDEFAAQFANEADGHGLLGRVRERLKDAVIEATLPDGTVITKKGVGFSYGIADTIETADQRLRVDKSAREATGERAGRGNEPGGVVKKPAPGNENHQGNPASQEVTPSASAAEIMAQATPETRELALRSAVAQAMDGRMPDVETLVRAAPPVYEGPTVTNKKGEVFADTRGNGKQFHGTSSPIESLRSDYALNGDNRNIYGQGFYTTDAVDIANGYMNKGNGNNRTLYTVTEKDSPKLFDMEAPLPDGLKAKAQEIFGSLYSETNHETGKPIKNLRELYDEVRAESRAEGLSRDEVQEMFDSMRVTLEDQGYHGFTHVGGLQTGNRGHQVKIYWNPEQHVSIERSDIGDFQPHELKPITPDEIRAAAEHQALPESRLTNDKAASDAANERLKTAPKDAAVETAEQEMQRATEKLADVRKNLEQGGFSPEALQTMDAQLKPFDDAIKQADELGDAARAAALCGLRS